MLPGLALGRRIDFLRLMSGRSISCRSTNDELRQISDSKAPARGCDNPLLAPPPPGAGGWGRPETAARRSMRVFATINALISSFLVCSNDKRVPRQSPMTFSANTADAPARHLPLLTGTLLFRAQPPPPKSLDTILVRRDKFSQRR